MQDLVAVLEPRDLVLEVLAPEHGLHCGRLGPVDLLDDAALDVGRESLVQPEVAPGRVGDEVARPRVRQLVRDQGDEALVAGEHGRRREGQARVLHAPEGEARRQDEDVVAVPAVRAVEPLGGLHHLLGVGELRRRGVDDRRLRVNAAARADGGEADVAGRDRHQVRRDPLRHLEPVGAAPGAGRVAGRAHDGDELRRRADRRGEGQAHRRRVLDRDPAARVDRLGLGEEERVPLARGLRRLEPLEARGAGAGRVGDPHAIGARGAAPPRAPRPGSDRPLPPRTGRGDHGPSPVAVSADRMSRPRVSSRSVSASGRISLEHAASRSPRGSSARSGRPGRARRAAPAPARGWSGSGRRAGGRRDPAGSSRARD